MRVAVLVSGNGTNLQALLDAERKGENPDGRVTLVVSSSDGAYALERARRSGIPALTIDKKAAGGGRAFEEQLWQAVQEQGVDLIVLAGFLHILTPEFIRRANVPMINIHPALLPAFGGKGLYGIKVHQAVLEAGAAVTGATVHYVNEIPDGGQIILQKELPVLPGDTPELLQQRVMEQAEWALLPQAVAQLCTELRKKEESRTDAVS